MNKAVCYWKETIESDNGKVLSTTFEAFNIKLHDKEQKERTKEAFLEVVLNCFGSSVCDSVAQAINDADI